MASLRNWTLKNSSQQRSFFRSSSFSLRMIPAPLPPWKRSSANLRMARSCTVPKSITGKKAHSASAVFGLWMHSLLQEERNRPRNIFWISSSARIISDSTPSRSILKPASSSETFPRFSPMSASSIPRSTLAACRARCRRNNRSWEKGTCRAEGRIFSFKRLLYYSKERCLGVSRKRNYQMPACKGSDGSPLRSSHQKSDLQKIWLIDIFECLLLLRCCRCKGRKPHRTSCELLDNRAENRTIYGIEPKLIDIEGRKRLLRSIQGNSLLTIRLRKITNGSEDSIRNARSRTTGAGDTACSRVFYVCTQELCGSLYNRGHFLRIVEIQFKGMHKAISERCAHRSNLGGCTNQCERLDIDPHGARGGALTDHDIEHVILHSAP